jgi:hypothetical protein
VLVFRPSARAPFSRKIFDIFCCATYPNIPVTLSRWILFVKEQMSLGDLAAIKSEN